MELDDVLLGLIRLHQGVTGYELNRIIKESTGAMLSASLSHIYPALKRLHEQGLVSFRGVPMKNRPSKKVYLITRAGEKRLEAWLEQPIESGFDFKPFLLKMAFSPLMKKQTILDHIDREIAYRAGPYLQPGRGISVEMDYLDKQRFDLARAQALWNSLYEVSTRTDDLRLAWLKEWRKRVMKEVKD